ncbi:MAG: DUF3734 domain-containing protein [Gemmobacter sp.]
MHRKASAKDHAFPGMSMRELRDAGHHGTVRMLAHRKWPEKPPRKRRDDGPRHQPRRSGRTTAKPRSGGWPV